MPIDSDLTINAIKLAESSVTDNTKEFNQLLSAISEKGPKWHEVGAARYREMRELGQTPLPKPVYFPEAKDETLPSRQPGREIPVRVYKPDNGKPSKGIFMHVHGGGYVVFTHRQSDSTLQRYANDCQLTAISIGYRLAPEDPYPAALEDCYDAAEYLVDHGEERFGSKLVFIGGESVGAHASAMSTFHLMRTRPQHKLAGVILTCGWFDLSLAMPQAVSFKKQLVINNEALQRFQEAFLPDMEAVKQRDSAVSPLHVDMYALAASSLTKTLPPALFTCGTQDPLLDDTILMSAKWQMSGSEGPVKLYPGIAHAFTNLPGLKGAEEANAIISQFVNEKVAEL